MSNLFLKIPANNKAKEDMDVIMENEGFRNVAISCSSHNTVVRFFCKLFSVMLLPARVGKGDVLLVQYPFKKYFALVCMLAHLRGGKVVALIHDLGSFRRKKLTVDQERRRLDNSDVIIVHNAAMKKFLAENGTTKPMVELGIFDYIADSAGMMPKKDEKEDWQVVYAGGLAKRKNTFLYLLDDYIDGWHFNIHGNGLDSGADEKWKSITFRGFIRPDDFVRSSIGHFGLVWDGSSIDECTGDWGEYLRINNPHKTSFYIRSGKPVIMWEKSALTPFVLREGVGIAVNSLREIGDKLKSITPEQYYGLCQRAAAVSKHLSSGHYFREAYRKALLLL